MLSKKGIEEEEMIKKIISKHFEIPDWLMKQYNTVNNFYWSKFCSPKLRSDYYELDQIAFEFTKMPYHLSGSIDCKIRKEGESPLAESTLILPITILEYTRHLLRYKFLELLCRNKRVLDCACGNGYGTYILSRGAREVVGIDFDVGLIKFAKKYNNAGNISFVNTTIGGLKEKGFDVIVSVETIEHIDVEDVDNFILGLKRCLKRDGLIVFTTPRVDETISYKKIDDYCHSHKREYSKKDLLDLLSKNGLKVEQYLLQKYDGSIIYQIPKSIRFPYATHKDSFVQIVICSKNRDYKKISPHKLRHTALSHWYMATNDIRFVQKIAGHSRITTTEIYVHSNVNYLKEVMEKAQFSYDKQRVQQPQIPAYMPIDNKKNKEILSYFG